MQTCSLTWCLSLPLSSWGMGRPFSPKGVFAVVSSLLLLEFFAQLWDNDARPTFAWAKCSIEMGRHSVVYPPFGEIPIIRSGRSFPSNGRAFAMRDPFYVKIIVNTAEV